MSQSPSLEAEVKDIIASSLRFYRASYREIIQIFLWPFFILALLKFFALPYVTNTGQLLYYLMVQLIVSPLLNAMVILFVYAKTSGHRVSPGMIYLTALKFWPSLLVLFMIIAGLGFLGMQLLVLPGIWILIRLSLTDIIYVIEKPGLIKTLQRGMERSQNRFWLIFLSLMAAGLPIFMASLLLSGLNSTLGNNAFIHIALELAMSFSFLIVHIILFRIYMMTKENTVSVP